MSCCQPKRVLITGAAGQIGYVLAFRIANGDLLKCQKVILHLLEIPPALPALNGVVMELTDCAFPNLVGVVATSDPEVGFKDIDYAFLVGSMPRKDGMDRSELLAKNGGIFKVQGELLGKLAKPTVKVLVVGNPANTNCLVAVHYGVLNGLKPENFSAMTRLDHNRALGEIAEKVGVTPGKVHKVCIWGNHSNTQVVDAEFGEVETADGIKKVAEALPKEYLEGEFVSKISTRGGAVIKARGASSAASAANAAIGQMYNWVWGTAYGEWVSMAIPVPECSPYGITPGLIFSFPVTVSACGKVSIVPGLTLSPFVQEKLKVTEKELLDEKTTAWEVLNIQ